jgi:2-polyprenyl-6-methoxyphenol hydroxylase-like FAD-dependent oxidoreductase
VVSNSPSAQPDTSLDVLVVGAGPTGLALAAQLQAYGVRFRVIDRQLDRVHESRALAVQPRTLEVLAGLGVSQRLVERGNQAVKLQIHFPDRVATLPLSDSGIEDTAYPYLLFVSQAETERILGEHLAVHGADLLRGVELTELDQTADLVRCRLRDGKGTEELVQARYVVGCDGVHSTVREQAAIAFRGIAYPQSFVLADLEADGVQPGLAHAFVSGSGMLFFFPLGTPATWRVLAMRPRADTTPVDRPVALDEVQALVDRYAGKTVRLRDPVWMSNFRLANRGASSYRIGRVFLAGDAAHVHSPAGAQGMNTGIQDATNLGWKLAYAISGAAEPSLLDTYEVERAPVGRNVLRFTDWAYTIATSTNTLLRFARTRVAPHLVPLALRAGAGRRYAFRAIAQLSLNYRHGPLSQQGAGPSRHGPRPGDRLPDGAVVQHGQATTLHTALGARGWHLLLCGSAAAWPSDETAEIGERYRGLLTAHRLTMLGEPGVLEDGVLEDSVLQDTGGQLLRRLGVRAGARRLYLVRPDGYVAYRADEAGLIGLRDYLDRWLRVPRSCP